MPTYTNITDDYIIDVNGFAFKSGEQKTTRKIINDPRIRLDSEEPYYQPVISDALVSASPSGTEVSIDVDGHEVIIMLTSGTDAEIYFNSLSNTPPFICTANRTFVFRNEGMLNKIYVVGSGTVNVKNVKTKVFEIKP